ncbi:TonB-linked SusC/RagA family outer membrane protein [Pedobacter sp. UYEF25]
MNGAKKIIFLIGLIFPLFANAQTKVNLNFTNAKFEQVIEAIQRQTVYHFAYSESKIPKQKVSIKVANVEAIKIVRQLLLNSGYKYVLLANNLIVISENIDANETADSVRLLKEVTITALGIEKENRKIGYAVATIDGSSIIKARESNLIMALQGRVAGLNITGVNGGPGSSARILIRGVSSMTAASPLFVVNGVPIDNSIRGSANEYGGADYGDGIANINPDDVEKITILKGSAASALYGARAANGVILINLKRGGADEGPEVEYNANIAFYVPINATDFQYIYGQGSQNKRPVSFSNAVATGLLSWGEVMDGKLSPQIDGTMQSYAPVKDNIKQFYRTAPALINTISLNGGDEKNNYRVSASNLDDNSILNNGSLNRKTFNFYGTVGLSSKISLNLTANYIYEKNKNKSYLSDGPLNANYGIAMLASSLNQSTLAPGFDAETGFESRWNADEYKTNPYFLLNKQADYADRNRYISSAVINYHLTNWLSLQGRLGYDFSKDKLVSILPTGTAFSINRQGGINAYDHNSTSEFNSDVLLSVSRKLAEKWDLEFSMGANYREREGRSDKLKGTQFAIPYLYVPENLITSTKTEVVSKIVTESVYYTADLSYEQYVNFSFTGRYDIYSTLPANNRGIFVPGISGSFIFSELLKIKNMNYGKLRLDFAKTSGEPNVPYTTQIYYTTDNQVNGIPVGGFSGDLPNYNLKPFTLNEMEAGLEFKFFNSRVDVDFTYFNRVTHNEIINAKQSVTTGFTSAYVNLGETQNAGLELALGYTPILAKTFKWQINLNATKVKNTLHSIDGNSNFTLTGTYRPLNANTALVVGKPITQILAYDYLRDANGNTVIGPDGIPKRGNFIPMGGTMPTLYGGLTNSITYKKFIFSFLIDYRFGNKILSATAYYSYLNGLNKATLLGREAGVVAEGVLEDGKKNTIIVPAYLYYPELATNVSALSVLNGSFIKFRQATLGYSFTTQYLRKIPFKSIGIDLIARNLFTLLKYSENVDPESQFSPTLGYAGIEGASLPATRTFGINLNFKLK